ncbi:hypothetical protein [Dongia sedimenti]|uniref:Uncharacterized protein n=1 Tax=Dongia sedimenti TaxID=3064282 RepID=A0ABU0YNQ7_9PROT|nr:hypothetical protein [Rhodospirillaceae bacterium R-7]
MMASTAETIHGATLTPRHRRWRDLSGWRLSFGLCLGPIASALLFALIQIFNMGATADDILAGTFGLLAFGMLWALVGGWIYLLAVVRTRRKIARMECLLLGIVLTNLIAPALFAITFAIEGWGGITEIIDDSDVSYFFALLLFSELLFSLPGLLSGWLFWRFGVRPAPVPQPDLTAVFD